MSNTRQIQVLTVLAVVVTLAIAAWLVSADDNAQPQMLPDSTTTVHSFADLSEVEDGWSLLRRYDYGLSMTLHTDDLVEGDAYTVWWVIFNQPENCSAECGEDDIFVFEADELVVDDAGEPIVNAEGVADAQISIQYATGSYVADRAKADFAASLGIGQTPGIIIGEGLANPNSAEVHLVVRTHGPMIEDAFDAQLLDFGGGCDLAACEDVQFAVHQPPAAA